MEIDSNIKAASSLVLCVHIGASSRHVAIMDENGTVLLKDEKLQPPMIRRSLEYKDLLADTVGALTFLIKKAVQQGIDTKAIRGGGAVVPGSVNPDTGYVSLLPALLGLRNTYLARDLATAMESVLRQPVPFWIENDANGRGLWELRFGYGKGLRDFSVVIVCTGLGGSLFLNGELYQGHSRRAGEIGHTTVLPDGPLCACGGRGCLETMASGGAILRSIRTSNSPLRTQDHLTYLQVFEAADRGDKEIVDILDRVGHYLGIGLANMVNTLNPERMILCGQLNHGSKFFRPGVEEEMTHRVFQGADCELVISDHLVDMEVRAALGTFLNYNERRI
jgi:glucokinase